MGSSTSEVNVEASVSGGAFGFSASASAGAKSGNTVEEKETDQTENSKTDSFTKGYTSDYGFSRSESSSDSTTNSDSTTDTQGQESRRDQSNDYNSGSTFEKSFEIPGDSRSASHSKAVAETEEFFQEFSGSISHTEASCVKFSARLNDISPPAFTRDFKDMIREMDSLTDKLWDSNIETKKLDSGKLISWKNEKNEKKFDTLFEKFIENFGT